MSRSGFSVICPFQPFLSIPPHMMHQCRINADCLAMLGHADAEVGPANTWIAARSAPTCTTPSAPQLTKSSNE